MVNQQDIAQAHHRVESEITQLRNSILPKQFKQYKAAGKAAQYRILAEASTEPEVVEHFLAKAAAQQEIDAELAKQLALTLTAGAAADTELKALLLIKAFEQGPTWTAGLQHMFQTAIRWCKSKATWIKEHSSHMGKSVLEFAPLVWIISLAVQLLYLFMYGGMFDFGFVLVCSAILFFASMWIGIHIFDLYRSNAKLGRKAHIGLALCTIVWIGLGIFGKMPVLPVIDADYRGVVMRNTHVQFVINPSKQTLYALPSPFRGDTVLWYKTDRKNWESTITHMGAAGTLKITTAKQFVPNAFENFNTPLKTDKEYTQELEARAKQIIKDHLAQKGSDPDLKELIAKINGLSNAVFRYANTEITFTSEPLVFTNK